MTNLDIMNMTENDFLAAYEKAKSAKQDKKPINSSNLTLQEQLERFEKHFFTDEESQVLHEDMLSV